MRALTIASLFFCLSCGPTPIFFGASPDRAHRIVVAQQGERLLVSLDGRAPRAYDALAVDRLRWSDRGIVLPALRDGTWWVLDADREIGPFRAVGPVAVAGPHVAIAVEQHGWRVLLDGRDSERFDAPPEEILLEPREGSGPLAVSVAYAARRRGAEHVFWNDRIGPACRRVGLLRLGAKGTMLAYVDRAEPERLFIDHRQVGVYDEVLELAVARSEPHWAAIVAEASCVLVHDGRRVVEAPLLTHLRLSDDGARTACLAPAEDGSNVAVILDGRIVSTHRRVEGETLAFVPGTQTLVALAEDSQGRRILFGDRESERYEAVQGPVFATGRVGWIGRRRGRSIVVVDGEPVAEEPWAGELRLAERGNGYAYVARRGDRRYVVTRRGSWPVPLLFVDTLLVDTTAQHWAALVPDPAMRTLDVWVDGLPRARIDERELGGALVASRAATPTQAIRAIVASELARALRE